MKNYKYEINQGEYIDHENGKPICAVCINARIKALFIDKGIGYQAIETFKRSEKNKPCWSCELGAQENILIYPKD